MNKKQRNRKQVTQNKRNRLINRRYSSTIKTLFKLFSVKIKNMNSNLILKNQDNLEISKISIDQEKQNINKLIKNLYSVIDKAIKKQVIHKNTAARKKSRIGKLGKLFAKI